MALKSGMYGNGGRFTSGGKHTGRVRGTRKVRHETPYRVAGTSAGQWSTETSHNTRVIFRNER